MMLEKKKAIITGPTGAVGLSLINELVDNDYIVYAVIRCKSPNIDKLPKNNNLKLIECNLDNLSELSILIKEKVDYFFHFAWDGTYGNERLDWQLQNKNVDYTINAVEVAQKLGCKAFIGAGSQSEFGHVDGILSPWLSCRPDNYYGVAKLSACNYSRVLCKEFGIRHEWCRIVSMYGPGDKEYTMVSTVISKLLNNEHISCTAGDQIWDYIYNKDAARAFRLVAEKGKDGEVYCLGSGKTKKLKEYIEIIKNNINSNITIGYGELPYYKNQVMHLQADISNLTNDTGFVPEYSFEDGIKETIEWIANRRK